MKERKTSTRKNWEIDWIEYCRYNSKGIPTDKFVKNGFKLKAAKENQIIVQLKNKKTKALEKVVLDLGQKTN